MPGSDAPAETLATVEWLLAEADVRAVVRILAETAVIEDANRQRTFLMSSLAEMLGVDTWVWGVSPLLEPGRQPVYVFHQTAGFDDGRLTRFLKAVEHPDTGAMTASLARAMIETGGQVTRPVQRIVSKERYQASPARPLWEAAGVGPLMLSIRPVADGGISVAGFYRELGAPDFTPRESRLMHILLAEVPWLHEAGLPHEIARPAPRLSPRERLILNQLVMGCPRKQIAMDLGLSENTVHGYVREIFRCFGVHSQVELIAKFTRGDGGDG